MCGRYYIDDDTAGEIEKLVRQVDEKMRQADETDGLSGGPFPNGDSDWNISRHNGRIYSCSQGLEYPDGIGDCRHYSCICVSMRDDCCDQTCQDCSLC